MSGATSGRDRSATGRRPGSRVREAEFRDATIKAFHEHGYASASLQMIADELGLFKGSLYYYMNSKEELLYHLMSEVHEQLALFLDRARTRTDLDPLERLYQYVVEHVNYSRQNTSLIAICYREVSHLTLEHRNRIDTLRDAQEEFVLGLLREAQDIGLVAQDADPAVLCDLIFGAIVWSVIRPYRDTPHSRSAQPSLADTCAQFVIKAVCTDPTHRTLGKPNPPNTEAASFPTRWSVTDER